jgi:hypothetical protein
VDRELVSALYKPAQWAVTPDRAQHDRRSIYLVAKRNLRLPSMEVFDQPTLNSSCGRRECSTHAPQALELLNGSLSNPLAEAFAQRLTRDAGADKAGPGRAGVPAGGRAAAVDRGTTTWNRVPGAAFAEGIRPGRLQSECVSLCSITRITAVRRAPAASSFQDAFCGFGSIALASILNQQQLRADDGVINPLAPKPRT